MLARALASSAPGLHHHEPRYFQFFLISVREQAVAQISTPWACKTEHFSRPWLPAQCQRRCPRRCLRKLLESDGMSSLAERALGWKQQRLHRRPAEKNARPRSLPGQRRSAPTAAAAVAAADPATVAATSTAAPAAAAAAGGRGGWGSQPSVANFSRMVGGGRGGGGDVEAPTRGTAVPGEPVFRQSGLCQPAEPTAEGGGGARTSWYPVRRRRELHGTSSVHPSPGQFRRPCSTVRKRG